MRRSAVLVCLSCLMVAVGCSSGSGGGLGAQDAGSTNPTSGPDSGGSGCGPGTITVTYQGSPQTAKCFAAIAVKTQAAQVQMGSTSFSSSSPVLTVGIYFPPTNYLASGQPACDIQAGKTLSMSDPCLAVSASYGVVGQKDEWLAFGGGSPEDSYALEDPALVQQLTGSLTVNEWSTQVGGTLSVTFSKDARLILSPGSSSPTVSISGDATATISP